MKFLNGYICLPSKIDVIGDPILEWVIIIVRFLVPLSEICLKIQAGKDMYFCKREVNCKIAKSI